MRERVKRMKRGEKRRDTGARQRRMVGWPTSWLVGWLGKEREKGGWRGKRNRKVKGTNKAEQLKKKRGQR